MLNPEIRRVMEDQAEEGDALSALALAVDGLASQVKNLGNADGVGPFGAIEGLAVLIKEGLAGVADAISESADR